LFTDVVPFVCVSYWQPKNWNKYLISMPRFAFN